MYFFTLCNGLKSFEGDPFRPFFEVNREHSLLSFTGIWQIFKSVFISMTSMAWDTSNTCTEV